MMQQEPRVEVDILVLKRVIKRLFEAEVSSKARLQVDNSPENQINPGEALNYAHRISEATPEARRTVELRYRGLLQALETGNGIDEALASFAA